MLRLIVAVVVGYLAMAVAVFGGLTIAYVTMGADRAFQSGLYAVSPFWIVTSFAVALAAAVLGGWVVRKVARTNRGPWVLAGVVVVLGLAMALPALLGDPAAAAVRTEAVGAMDAMMQAQTPLWIQLLNPFVGALGVLLGGGALPGMGTPERPAVQPAV